MIRVFLLLLVIFSTSAVFAEHTERFSFALYQSSAVFKNYSKKDPIGSAEIVRTYRDDGTVSVRETITGRFQTEDNGPFGMPISRSVDISRTCTETKGGRTLAFEEAAKVGRGDVTATFDQGKNAIVVRAASFIGPDLKRTHKLKPTALAPTRQTYDLLFQPPQGKRTLDYAYRHRAGAFISKPVSVTVTVDPLSKAAKPRDFFGKSTGWTCRREWMLLGDGDKAFHDADGRLTRWTIKLYDLKAVEAFPVSSGSRVASISLGDQSSEVR